MGVNKKVLFMAQFALLLAIEIIVCFTPLGSIPIGPLVATLAAVPVIITSILLGTGAGTLMGFFTGLFSFLVWTFMPPSPLGFVFTPFYSVGEVQGNFWSLVICFVPRILIGTVAGLSYRGFTRVFSRWPKLHFLPYVFSGILGSLTNTILVLGGIYLFFGQEYAVANGISYALLLGALGVSVATNGLLEAAIGGLSAYVISRPVQKALKRFH